MSVLEKINELLGENQTEELLNHKCITIPKEKIQVPGADFIDRVLIHSDRKNATLRNLNWIYNTGRLAGTGYLSILPVDQGIEHTGGASFAPNPDYFDPDNILKLAIEGGCNAVTSTLGVLGSVSRKYAHKIPFIVKLNHNELLTYPAIYDQTLFANVEQAFEMGAVAVGATIYFGSQESRRQIQEIGEAFALAHELGMVTVLWAYLRNSAFSTKDNDYHFAADLTGQANHLGATIEADIVKQKLPENNGGFNELNFGKTNPKMYGEICTDNQIDMVRYQVANTYMGRIGLINSGGASKGKSDFAEIAKTAIINKRGGGMGLITGRKSFQRPFKEGVEFLNFVQDIYLEEKIDIA